MGLRFSLEYFGFMLFAMLTSWRSSGGLYERSCAFGSLLASPFSAAVDPTNPPSPTTADNKPRPSSHSANGRLTNQPVPAGYTVTKALKTGKHGKRRYFSVHLPMQYDAEKSYPVIFGFHGGPGVGLFFEGDSKLSEERYSKDKIMVYPNGVGGCWSGAGYAKVSEAEDIQFIDDIIKVLRAEYNIDESRIYAAGHSNGGSFVNVLACSTQVGPRFAAFASAAGAYYTTDPSHKPNPGRTPGRALTPLLIFHGLKDTTVPYTGGKGRGGQLPSVEAWVQWWTDHNGASVRTTEDICEGEIHHTTWRREDGDVRAEVQLYKIDHQGHSWPSKESNWTQLGLWEYPTRVEASELIVEFFDRHSLPVVKPEEDATV